MITSILFVRRVIFRIALLIKRSPMQLPLYLSRLGIDYQNILRLPKVADGIDVKGTIPEEICGDCMNRRQQRKPSYEPMTQPKEYLEYLYCDLGGSYPPTRRGNRFYLGIRDGATGTYYAEPMRTKGQIFDTFQIFIRRAEHQGRSSSIYVPTLGENLQIKPLRYIRLRRVLSESQVRLILRSKMARPFRSYSNFQACLDFKPRLGISHV